MKQLLLYTFLSSALCTGIAHGSSNAIVQNNMGRLFSHNVDKLLKDAKKSLAQGKTSPSKETLMQALHVYREALTSVQVSIPIPINKNSRSFVIHCINEGAQIPNNILESLRATWRDEILRIIPLFTEVQDIEKLKFTADDVAKNQDFFTVFHEAYEKGVIRRNTKQKKLGTALKVTQLLLPDLLSIVASYVPVYPYCTDALEPIPTQLYAGKPDSEPAPATTAAAASSSSTE
jgi:hypothetical protein